MEHVWREFHFIHDLTYQRSWIKKLYSCVYQHDEERSALASFFFPQDIYKEWHHLAVVLFQYTLIHSRVQETYSLMGFQLVTVRLMFRPYSFHSLSCLSLGTSSIIILPFSRGIKSISRFYLPIDIPIYVHIHICVERLNPELLKMITFVDSYGREQHKSLSTLLYMAILTVSL